MFLDIYMELNVTGTNDVVNAAAYLNLLNDSPVSLHLCVLCSVLPCFVCVCLCSVSVCDCVYLLCLSILWCW